MTTQPNPAPRNVAQNLAEQVAPLVVRLGRDRRGSGLLVAPGKILTNAHTLRNPTIQVSFSNGASAQGNVTAVDPDGDLAVVTVDGPDLASEAFLLWSELDAALGDDVYVVSLTSSGPRVTKGEVSAVGRSFSGPRGRVIDGSIEHTAPIARGGSGTPLIDAQGRLLGMNTHRLGDGFYLALPGDARTKERIAQLLAGKSPNDRRLGVALARADVAQQLRRSVGLPERDGLLVRGVSDDSPGAKAGLREGDLLVSANGSDLKVVADLESVLLGLPDEQKTVVVGVVRGTEEVSVTVTFD